MDVRKVLTNFSDDPASIRTKKQNMDKITQTGISVRSISISKTIILPLGDDDKIK